MKEINIDNKNENIQKENELIISKTFKKEKDFSGNLYSREKNLTFNIKDIQKDRQNIIKIENSDLEFVDINENFTKKPNTAPFDDICSMCSSKIYFKKYICIVCRDCVLCQDCQEEHLHPIIKCKQTQLSTVQDIYNYLKNSNNKIKQISNQKTKKYGIFGNLFSEKYELKLNCNALNFSMRPNKKINIPITVQNLSNVPFNCEQNNLILFARNNKDLKVYEKKVGQILNKKEQIDVNMILESNDMCKIYYFTIELYTSEEIKLKSNILSFTLEVNNDEEDEILNEEFKDFPKVIVMNKNIKKGIKKILEDKSITQDPVLVMQFLSNNNGDIEKTIQNLKSMNIKAPIL
jgi:hypothetical protein